MVLDDAGSLVLGVILPHLCRSPTIQSLGRVEITSLPSVILVGQNSEPMALVITH